MISLRQYRQHNLDSTSCNVCKRRIHTGSELCERLPKDGLIPQKDLFVLKLANEQHGTVLSLCRACLHDLEGLIKEMRR